MTHSIAVVGMACRYPDARSPDELWENVLTQRRAFRRLPQRHQVCDRAGRDHHPTRVHRQVVWQPDERFRISKKLCMFLAAVQLAQRIVRPTIRAVPLVWPIPPARQLIHHPADRGCFHPIRLRRGPQRRRQPVPCQQRRRLRRLWWRKCLRLRPIRTPTS